MINYEELKTALTDISNICRMTDCDKCPLKRDVFNDWQCMLYNNTPNNWFDEGLSNTMVEQFAARGAHLVENGYIDE